MPRAALRERGVVRRARATRERLAALALALRLLGGPAGAARAEEDSVTVRAARPTAAPSSVLLTRDDLSAAPRRDAEELLRQIPNLTLLQHGSEGKGRQVLLRGFDAIHGQDFEVTVDGVRLNEWSNIHAQGYLDLALMIPECVASVEGLKGPFSLSQGLFAMAGSAHYALGAPRLAGGGGGASLSYGAGTPGRHRAVGAYARGGGWGAAELLHDVGFGARRALSRAAVNAHVPLAESARGRLSLTLLAAASSFALPTALRLDDVAAGRVGFYGSYDDALGGSARRGLGLLRWEGAAGSVTLWGQLRDLALVENFTGALADPAAGDRRGQRHAARAVGLAARAERAAGAWAWGALALVGEAGA
ncbi:MAG: hypothetical protein FJ138_04755, partial [Deltaproteobacteria bacterium]|nr:hypothetical protein [Deltaproteobacteria bacterium]